MRFLRYLPLGLLLTAGLASAQSYPDKSRPIKLIVPFGAGSSADVLARALGRGMTDVAGVNVVVDNKPGAEAVIGMQAAKLSAPDGYTMVLTTISTQAVNLHMLANMPYDPIADFVPLAGVAKISLMMNVGPSVPFKSAREFIAAARANPGKYTFGNASATTRLAGEMLQRSAGIQLVSVPYKNFTDALSNLASGELDTVIVDAATAGAFYKQNVRPLASAGSSRVALYPNVPTLKEEGVADYEVDGWFAAYFPAKTPPAIAAAMRDILRDALKTKYVAEVYGTFAMEPLDLFGDRLDAFQRAELDKWGKAVKAANLGPKKQ